MVDINKEDGFIPQKDENFSSKDRAEKMIEHKMQEARGLTAGQVVSDMRHFAVKDKAPVLVQSSKSPMVREPVRAMMADDYGNVIIIID